ncbi:unnamed protein product [Malus baccata var. baccata]
MVVVVRSSSDVGESSGRTCVRRYRLHFVTLLKLLCPFSPLRYEVQWYNNRANIWFSNAIGPPCTLLRCFGSNYNHCLNKSESMSMCREAQSMLNFSNEARFLLISEESVSDLNQRESTSMFLHSNGTSYCTVKGLQEEVQRGARGAAGQINPMRFGPNLVLSGGEPYEDGWGSLKIGNKYFAPLGGCNRCQTINIVHEAGQVQKSKEPLSALATYRRVKVIRDGFLKVMFI